MLSRRQAFLSLLISSTLFYTWSNFVRQRVGAYKVLQNKLHRCLFATQNGHQFYQHLTSIVNHCVKRHTNIKKEHLLILPVGRNNESKVFLNYTRPSKNCSFLSIGIGNDIEAELAMKRLHPTCTFTGLDPKSDQGSVYEQIGTFIPYGLAVDTGLKTMGVRLPNTRYQFQSVPTIDAAYLVQKYLRTGFIQFGTIDIEGYEYKLLQQLATWPKDAGLTICQLDIELHRFGNDSTQYEWLNRLLLHNELLIPIYAADHIGHRKLTLLNQLPTCRRLFDILLLTS